MYCVFYYQTIQIMRVEITQRRIARTSRKIIGRSLSTNGEVDI